MGYDDNECLVCYLTGRGNKLVAPEYAAGDMNTAVFCLVCLHELSREGDATWRVTRALNQLNALQLQPVCGREKRFCECKCWCFDEDAPIYGHDHDPKEKDYHDSNCNVIRCEEGDMSSGTYPECHEECPTCDRCERCVGGAIVIVASACAKHGGGDMPEYRY